MNYPSIHLEGSILSSELVDSIAQEDKHSQNAADFGLPPSTKVKDEIASAWAAAKPLWTAYQAKITNLGENDSGTSETRNLFVLPLLSLLGYEPENTNARTLNGKSYAISHRDPSRDSFPIHIMGWHDSLERKRTSGGPRMSPHALVQEYLNLTEHLYALVTNGQQLRLLRDSSRLIKLSYLEFDLVRMFEEDLYADFAILYRLLHASRMPANQATIAEAIIEQYHQDSLDSGARIRDGLAEAVAFAMETIANGLLKHPGNEALKTQLKETSTGADDLQQNLLRWVYRTLFLLVIEERGLNHSPKANSRQRRIYRDYYSLQRLRRLADRPQLADPRAHDLWRSMHQTLSLYESEGKGGLVGIDPLGSFLFEEKGLQNLFQYELDNRSFLLAINRLSTFPHPDTKVRMRVNYGALDVEEFGSVYEMLLELSPHVVSDGESVTFNYAQLAGSDRKTSGSYYTPDSLVQCLLDSALDPVIDERLSKVKSTEEKEAALLAIKVCDPAVGSGHFLIGAAHRLARRLAEIRSGDEALSPETQRQALREAVSHCLYGVDINPLSVELCKVSLWMLGMEPGKPLSFLDHHIQCGNSLLGTTPALMEKGIPQDAFKPIEGDNKDYCNEFKRANKDEAKNILGQRQATLFDREQRPWEHIGTLATQIIKLDALPEDTVEQIRAKETRYAEAVRSSDYLSGKFLADLWCAAFVWKKSKPEHGGFDYPITNDYYYKAEQNPNALPHWMREETQRLAKRYQFFHWHLAFPEVFQIPASLNPQPSTLNQHTGWTGGFDVILGNPPWEHVELKEKEFFASRAPYIANARTGAERKKLIAALDTEDPALHTSYLEAKRVLDGAKHYLSNSGAHPLCGRGRVNLYTVFAEANRFHLNPTGLTGCVLPTGIATDDTTKFFFQDLMDTRSLRCLFDFENKNIFPNVHSSYKFCCFTAGSGVAPVADQAEFAFFLHATTELGDPGKRFKLSPEDIALLNPNTRTCPIFRSRQDAELTRHVYRRVPVLINENDPQNGNPWGITFKQGLFNMTSDSHLFKTRQDLESDGWELKGNTFHKENETYLPLYEAKMTQQWNHRAADVVLSATAQARQGQPDEISTSELESPSRLALPRYWTNKDKVTQLVPDSNAVLGFSDVTSPTNARSMLATIIPRYGVGHTFPLIHPSCDSTGLLQLIGCLNSFSFDFMGRQKLGGLHYTYFILRQCPLPSQATLESCEVIKHAAFELTYTAWDLEPFARDCGYDGPPFRWDEDRRFLLRCELDAAFFHLYLGTPDEWRDQATPELLSAFPTPRHAIDYIMETFPIVKRKDIARTEVKDEKNKVINEGSYITKDTILSIYDEMQQAIDSGQPYKTRLDPPPGPPADESGNFTPVAAWGDAWPHHIHLPKDALAGGRTEFRLSDLRNGMPQGRFEVLPDDISSNDRIQLERTHPDELKTGDVIAVVHPEITCQGNNVGVALGELKLSEQMDAETGEVKLLVVIKDSRGLAQLKLTPPDWLATDQIARVIN